MKPQLGEPYVKLKRIDEKLYNNQKETRKIARVLSEKFVAFEVKRTDELLMAQGKNQAKDKTITNKQDVNVSFTTPGKIKEASHEAIKRLSSSSILSKAHSSNEVVCTASPAKQKSRDKRNSVKKLISSSSASSASSRSASSTPSKTTSATSSASSKLMSSVPSVTDLSPNITTPLKAPLNPKAKPFIENPASVGADYRLLLAAYNFNNHLRKVNLY